MKKFTACVFAIAYSVALIAPAAEPPVSGTFKGNGKVAKLAFVTAKWGEEFSGKPGIDLIFTEKDHSKDKKPDFKASFGDYGNALIFRMHEDGTIFGCQIVHSAHKKQGFSSVGSIKSEGLKVADGVISGRIYTPDGEEEFFGDKWEVDIKFSTKLAAAPAPPKTLPKPEPKPEPKPDPKPKPEPKPEPKDPPATSGKKFNVHDLPLPSDATDVEYKKLVGHVTFLSPLGPKAVGAALQKDLEKQGWKVKSVDLVNERTCILHRTLDGAELTIIGQAADKGTKVLMTTKGLDWEDK